MLSSIMSEQSDTLTSTPKYKLGARPSMILEEPSLSVKGNWMQQANQRLLLRMARFTEEDRMRMQECIFQSRQSLLQANIVSLVGPDDSRIFRPFQRLKKNNENSLRSNCSKMSNDQPNYDINTAIKLKFWTYSRKPIRQSLIKSTKKDIDKTAVKIFHIILSYANHSFRLESDSDSESSLKSTQQTCLIQSLLEKVLSFEDLKDEIYLQLIKQTTDNNDIVGGTNHKYWHILAVVCNVIKPKSKQVLDYIEAHFKISGIDSTTDERRYSIYCQKCLSRTADKSIRSFIASTKEINAVIRRQCIKLKIYLFDGSYRKVEVYSHTSNAEMNKMMKNKVCFKQETIGWSIFEQIGSIEKHCNPKELVSDMIYRWESLNNARKFSSKVYLIYKKRIFDERSFNESDPVEIELLTHQCISDIYEDRLKVTHNQAAEICALRLLQEDSDPSISLRILPQYLRSNINKILISQIAANTRNLPDFTIKSCNLKILKICKKCEQFGALHFSISQYSMSIWPTEIILSINRRGLYFAARCTNSILLFLPFSDIVRFSFQSIGFFTIAIKHDQITELKMFSNVPEDITSLIRDYMIDQKVSESRTPSRSSNGMVNNNIPTEQNNSTDAEISTFSLNSLPVNKNELRVENQDFRILNNDGQKHNLSVGYLSECLDSCSIQSDNVFELNEEEPNNSLNCCKNNFDFQLK